MCATTQFTPQHERVQCSDTHTHTHTHTHTQLPQCVSSRLAGGLRVDAAWKIPESSLPNFSQRKHCLTLYKLSAGPVWHSMCTTIWHLRVSSRTHLTRDPVSSRSPLRSNLSRGWWWAGAASAAANRGNMLLPSVVYFPSISLCFCRQLI